MVVCSKFSQEDETGGLQVEASLEHIVKPHVRKKTMKQIGNKSR